LTALHRRVVDPRLRSVDRHRLPFEDDQPWLKTKNRSSA
jgi:hypothetical protein